MKTAALRSPPERAPHRLPPRRLPARIPSSDRADELIEKFRLLLASPMAEGVARIVEESFRLLPIIPPPVLGGTRRAYSPPLELEPARQSHARICPARSDRDGRTGRADSRRDRQAALVNAPLVCQPARDQGPAGLRPDHGLFRRNIPCASSGKISIHTTSFARRSKGPNRVASGSSAWATSACPWRARSPAGAFRSWASTSTRPRSPGSSAARATSGTSPTQSIADVRENGFEATDRLRAARRARRDHHLRPDPAAPTREPDLTLRRRIRPRRSPRGCGPASSSSSRARPTRARPATSSCPCSEASGLRAGTDFFLAFSPEREDPGNPRFSAPTIPKVVGGLEPASLELAAALYGQVVVRGRARLEPRGRRGLQDPREHLPRRQHRAGQRAEESSSTGWASTSGR